MANIRELSDYCLIGNIDLKQVERLHNFVGECRENLFKNIPLQNLIFGGGYDFDNRPKNYFDIENNVWLRKNTSLCLEYINMVIDLATTPQLVIPHSNSLIITPDYEMELQTLRGFDFEKVQELQSEWWENPIREKIREYQTDLQNAFNEFNMQFILDTLLKAQHYYVDIDTKERRLQDRIKVVYDGRTRDVLEDAYYIKARQFYNLAGQLWPELFHDNFGKNFVLDAEEVKQGVVQKMKDLQLF